MIVASVNRADPVTIQFNNQDVETGIFKKPINTSIKVSEYGLEGDAVIDKAVHGGLDQAVYLYHKEDYDWWTETLGKPIAFGTFGENITIMGTDDINWVIGDRLFIGDIELEISAPRTPCFKLGVRMDDSGFVKKFAKANRPGAYARVIQGGTLAAGNSITVEKTTKNYASVKEVFAEWHSKEKSPATLKRALESPIASVHKQKIQAWYEELVN